MTTNENVENEMEEHQVEHKNTVEEMAFDELTIPGEDSDYYILE